MTETTKSRRIGEAMRRLHEIRCRHYDEITDAQYAAAVNELMIHFLSLYVTRLESIDFVEQYGEKCIRMYFEGTGHICRVSARPNGELYR